MIMKLGVTQFSFLYGRRIEEFNPHHKIQWKNKLPPTYLHSIYLVAQNLKLVSLVN